MAGGRFLLSMAPRHLGLRAHRFLSIF